MRVRTVLAEDEAALEERRRELATALSLAPAKFLFATPEQFVEWLLPFAALGACDGALIEQRGQRG